MPNRPIDVAFCFDDHLALPAAVAMLSLVESNPPPLRIHAFMDPGSKAGPLLSAIAQRHGVTLEVTDRGAEMVRRFESSSNYGGHSTATYRRILLAELLPELDRVIYLDVDLIVNGSVEELWDTALDGAPLAAVPDPWMSTLEPIRRAFPRGYFNAGVMLLDLARWRSDRLTERVIAALELRTRQAVAREQTAQHFAHDQTPLNDALHGQWRILSPRWNCTTYLTRRLAAELGVGEEEYREILADPGIVHFLGAHKPWVPGFAELTPWHRAFQALRERLERDFALGPLVWPGPFINGSSVRLQRRLIALRLVQRARAQGFESPDIVLTGLLGREVLLVARENGMSVGSFVTESPVYSGGRLHDVDIVTVAEAIEQGQRDFIIGDYRRLDRTRDHLLAEAARRGAELRLVAIDN